jgi:hypothetical protein
MKTFLDHEDPAWMLRGASVKSSKLGGNGAARAGISLVSNKEMEEEAAKVGKWVDLELVI